MSGVESVKSLLKHYVEHSREHTEKYAELASRLRGVRDDVSETIARAVEKFREGEELLEKALRMLEEAGGNA